MENNCRAAACWQSVIGNASTPPTIDYRKLGTTRLHRSNPAVSVQAVATDSDLSLVKDGRRVRLLRCGEDRTRLGEWTFGRTVPGRLLCRKPYIYEIRVTRTAIAPGPLMTLGIGKTYSRPLKCDRCVGSQLCFVRACSRHYVQDPSPVYRAGILTLPCAQCG
jgi:hypothetical protein